MSLYVDCSRDSFRFAAAATEKLTWKPPMAKWWSGGKTMKESQVYTKTFGHVDACTVRMYFSVYGNGVFWKPQLSCVVVI